MRLEVSDSVDPIHQFGVLRLVPVSVGGVDISFTNVSLFMAATVIISSLFLLLTSSGRRLVPTPMQSVSEICYEFVARTLRESAGAQAMRFFPLVFSLFIFILMANCLGLFPYFYTVTAQIIVTFALSMLVIMTVVIYGIIKNGFRFLRIFVPGGVPLVLLPLVSLIEFISFLSRPVSLSVRLFANMLAGHITLKVFAGFIVSLATLGPLGIGGAVLPLIMTVALTALEVLVAFLQAYVFAVLTCIYLSDAIHPAH
ncbi:F0F1 ATP synthase subunit A [Candidatus Tokpelaia sp.]|uniref:F0F1 ATP synthase subunit A n=1 Tax=Candidatus Tokpelaia sp. TaxID=2233777 RepID=UPI00123ACC09|nr:F0F1 ATP synthase subunit A [Candidatus Tokpelaia sp.]KAA6405310.1 F0F1 ATP synthase subunit A [Candidatus Tokpelaia sp.]